MDFSELSLGLLIGCFVVATVIVVLAGVRVTGIADRIADVTGLGEAVIGGALLGMVTSLSGVTVSVTAAMDGRAALAFSNAVGGIAAQTAFLALADMVYRKINLEHAAAELANIVQAALLAMLLTLPILAFAGPPMTIWGVHPASIVLVLGYIIGLRLLARVREKPMWTAVQTPETRADDPEDAEEAEEGEARSLFLRFALLGLALATAGWVIAGSGGALADRYGISETFAGAILTAVATSLPELVTTLAAIRRGALQLAVGGVIGGNTFDMLFLTAADVAYRDGSLYHAIGTVDLFWVTVGLAMTCVLILGLLLRERDNVLRVGFDGVAILGLYIAALAFQIFAIRS